MRKTIRISILVGAAASLAGCMGGRSRPPAELGRIAPPVLGWRLPKTVLDVTVTWTPTRCVDTANGPVIDVKVVAEALPRAVPDPDLGPDFENGLVRVDTGDLASFWTDASVGYTVHPDTGGLLKTIGSHPVNQTGTIVGNFLTGAVKIAGAALAAPAALGEGRCGTAFTTTLKDIDRIKARMAGQGKVKAEDDAQRLVSLREKIAIVVRRTLDTAVTPPDATGLLSTFQPDPEQVTDRKWRTLKGNADPRHLVYLVLDFSRSTMLAPLACAAGATTCVRPHSRLDRAALFRQAAYVPVVFRTGKLTPQGGVAMANGRAEYADDPVAPARIVSFGQYGSPRTLPLKVGAFRDTNWALEFSQTGEITSSTYANKATGVGLSSAFAGAAGAASDLAGLPDKAASSLDTETLRLQAENARLKALTDNRDLKAKLELQNAPNPDE